jgi:hypothetical protein
MLRPAREWSASACVESTNCSAGLDVNELRAPVCGSMSSSTGRAGRARHLACARQARARPGRKRQEHRKSAARQLRVPPAPAAAGADGRRGRERGRAPGCGRAGDLVSHAQGTGHRQQAAQAPLVPASTTPVRRRGGLPLPSARAYTAATAARAPMPAAELHCQRTGPGAAHQRPPRPAPWLAAASSRSRPGACRRPSPPGPGEGACPRERCARPHRHCPPEPWPDPGPDLR